MSEPLDAAPSQQPPTFQPPPPPSQPPAEPPARRPKKMLTFGIGFFVLGVIVLILEIVKVLPGGITGGAGASICIFGIVLAGLSFVPWPRLPETEPPLSPMQK